MTSPVTEAFIWVLGTADSLNAMASDPNFELAVLTNGGQIVASTLPYVSLGAPAQLLIGPSVTLATAPPSVILYAVKIAVDISAGNSAVGWANICSFAHVD